MTRNVTPCLAVAGFFVLLASPAFAGSTFIGPCSAPPCAPVFFAAETAFPPPNNYLLPQAPLGTTPTIRRRTSIIPNNSLPGISNVVNYEIDLLDGATFSNIVAITAGNFNHTGFGSCSATNTIALKSATQLKFRVTLGPPFTGVNQTCGTGNVLLRFNPPNGLGVNDNNGNLVTPGGLIRVRAMTTDGSDVETDAGAETVPYLVSITSTFAFNYPTTATIDVGVPSNKRNFVPNPPDTLTQDGGGVPVFLAIEDTSNFVVYFFYQLFGFNVPLVFDGRGPATAGFCPDPNFDPGNCGSSAGFYTINLAGDFTGVTSVVYNPAGIFGQIPISATPSAGAASVKLTTLDSALWSSFFYPAPPMVINVDGTTALMPRTINLTGITYTDQATSTIKNTPIAASQPYTVWSYNGSVLFAPFVNGNTNQFKSRFYVCIPQSSGTSGATIKLITQPVAGSSGTALATVTTTEGIASQGCLNFRLEDVLAAGGISTPYTNDGGNLAAEFTILAAKSKGTVNVINFQPSTGPESVATYNMFEEK